MPIACPRCQQANSESDERCCFCNASLTVSLWAQADDASPPTFSVKPVEGASDIALRLPRPMTQGRVAREPLNINPPTDDDDADRGGAADGAEPLQPMTSADAQAFFEVEGAQEVFFRGSYTTRVPLKGGSLLVGRRDVMANHYPDIDLMMYRKLDPAISRRHLRVFREGGVYYVEDLCNNNATFINDYSNKLNHERKALQDGDRVFVSMSLALIFRRSA
jgi:hypothetical protein